jgi:hypothetical protein
MYNEKHYGAVRTVMENKRYGAHFIASSGKSAFS